MANEFFTASGYPGFNASGDSASARAEFTAVQTAFDKLPILTGNAGKCAVVNAAGTGLEATFKPANLSGSSAQDFAAANLTASGQLRANAITASTSTTTGALVVSGGAGIAGAAYFGNSINVTNNIARGGAATVLYDSFTTSGALRGYLVADASGLGILAWNGAPALYIPYGTVNTQLSGILDISSTAAGQIKFPATQNASADPNTFDDYKEGTWTPTATNFTGTNTYSGTYSKIGNRVFFEIQVSTTTTIAATGGYLTVPPTAIPNTPSCCTVSNVASGAGIGVGHINAVYIYVPTITTTAGQSIVISGSYKTL